MPTNWLPSKAYAYQPGTGTTTQMPSPVFDAAYKRLMEEQKQRSAGREKILVPNDPNGSFYYKDAPGTILPGRSGAENAYYNEVNAGPKPFNPMQYFDPVEAQKYFTPPGVPQQESSRASYAATPESQAAYQKLIAGRDLDKELADFLATPEMQLRLNAPNSVKVPEGQYLPGASTSNAPSNSIGSLSSTPQPASKPASTIPTVPTPNTYNFSPPTNPADALSGVSNNNSPTQQQNTSYTSPAGGTRKKQFANKWFGKQQFL